jgi:hypothetical protein
MPQPSRVDVNVADVESDGGTPYYALGVYASGGMMHHFSGLAVSSRGDGDWDSTTSRTREAAEEDERAGGGGRATDARRVYYA